MMTKTNNAARPASVRFEDVNSESMRVFWRVHPIGFLRQTVGGWYFSTEKSDYESLIDILPWHKEKAKGVLQARINNFMQ